MPCHFTHLNGQRVILCTPAYDDLSVIKKRCLDRHCRRETYHVVGAEAYYGIRQCCMRCGRVSSCDGMELAFEPLPPGKEANKAREENKKYWRRLYKNRDTINLHSRELPL